MLSTMGRDSSVGRVQTEKPGAILTQAQVPGVARDVSPIVNLLCRLSYSVCTAPMRNHMHQNLFTRSKFQTVAAMPMLGHTKILHMLIGKGSAALVDAVPYPGYVTQISHKGQRRTK